jgi:pyruvate/oxaloacetate carboxyltransferase
MNGGNGESALALSKRRYSTGEITGNSSRCSPGSTSSSANEDFDMHIAIRAAGFSLMTMFVSCGVGAQELDTRIAKIAMEDEMPAHESIARLCRTGLPTGDSTMGLSASTHHLDLSFKYD